MGFTRLKLGSLSLASKNQDDKLQLSTEVVGGCWGGRSNMVVNQDKEKKREKWRQSQELKVEMHLTNRKEKGEEKNEVSW